MPVIVLDDLFRKIQRLTSNNIASNIDLKFETWLLIKLSGLTKALSVRTKLKSARILILPQKLQGILAFQS